MKTLDEVIKAYEQCAKSDWEEGCGDCAYRNEKCGSCKCVRNDDALHYLKEYREKHDEILRMEEALGYCEIMANQPLTWAELKAMEDKPVWIEYGTDEDTALKRWCLVLIVLDEYISLATTAIQFRAEKSKQGKTWQAYRKERNESDR